MWFSLSEAEKLFFFCSKSIFNIFFSCITQESLPKVLSCHLSQTSLELGPAVLHHNRNSQNCSARQYRFRCFVHLMLWIIYHFLIIFEIYERNYIITCRASWNTSHTRAFLSVSYPWNTSLPFQNVLNPLKFNWFASLLM